MLTELLGFYAGIIEKIEQYFSGTMLEARKWRGREEDDEEGDDEGEEDGESDEESADDN